MLTLFAVAVVVLAIYAVGIFKRLADLRHNCQRRWNNLEPLFVLRDDELSKLVAACRQHQEFEKQTLEPAMAALRIHLEAHPTLKTDPNIQALMTRINGLENAIRDRCEFYNEAVTLHNQGIKLFPDFIIAAACGLRAKPGLSSAAALDSDQRDIKTKEST